MHTVINQPTHDVLRTSPEGPSKVLASRTYRRPSGDSQETNKKIYDFWQIAQDFIVNGSIKKQYG